MGLTRRSLLIGGTAAVGAFAVPRALGLPPPPPLPETATQRGTTKWRVNDTAPAAALSGYAQDSIRPGEPLRVRVSAANNWRGTVYRIGDYEGRGGLEIASTRGNAQQHDFTVDPSTRAVSAAWPVAAELTTDDWPEGLYVLMLRSKAGESSIPFVVRSASADGRTAIVASSLTWQAYNIWGGASLYKNMAGDFGGRSLSVSYDRPYDHSLWGRPISYSYDVPVARFVDELDLDLAWFTNADISRDPTLLSGARTVVSTGHDEYWTQAYRDALVNARDAGSDLAFLGANVGYWHVTLNGNEVRCPKDSGIDAKNIRWRDLGTPESSIVGMQYDAFPVSGPMVVREPDFVLFEGIKGVRTGASYPGLVGIEADRFYPDSHTPRDIEVPTLSPVTCRGVPTWSTMTYYSTPSDAKVWAVGTMNWTRGLTGPNADKGITKRSSEFVRLTTANFLAKSAAGTLPAAQRDVPDLPGHNTSGAA
ncbi:MAG: hypothetical protein KDC39_14340 [Actinobacteria bacterium]|nr:hypothetical protein [Actinomycetota bacterium]